jgi:hypothetical protein
MKDNESIPNFFSELFGQKFGYSESDIISMYIDGRISKEEYIERMNNVRGNKVR